MDDYSVELDSGNENKNSYANNTVAKVFQLPTPEPTPRSKHPVLLQGVTPIPFPSLLGARTLPIRHKRITSDATILSKALSKQFLFWMDKHSQNRWRTSRQANNKKTRPTGWHQKHKLSDIRSSTSYRSVVPQRSKSIQSEHLSAFHERDRSKSTDIVDYS